MGRHLLTLSLTKPKYISKEILQNDGVFIHKDTVYIAN